MSGERPIQEVLLVVDVINDFDHDDGDALLASFRERLPSMVATLDQARTSQMPVVYANDAAGHWHGDAPALVRHAIQHGAGGDVVAALAPRSGDRFIFKPRYSAFDHTPLEPILRSENVGRIFLAGAAVEGCVVQTAIDARELRFQVTIVSGACATVDEELEDIALAYATRVGGVRTAESLLLSHSSRAPKGGGG
jgi:nicotinamidase-related amidase